MLVGLVSGKNVSQTKEALNTFIISFSKVIKKQVAVKNEIDAPKENQCTTRWLLNGSSIKSGTWNIPEHPGISNNYDNYEKNM